MDFIEELDQSYSTLAFAGSRTILIDILSTMWFEQLAKAHSQLILMRSAVHERPAESSHVSKPSTVFKL